MKKCKWCKEEIDVKARVCPHCRKKQNGSGKVVIFIILVFAIIGIISSTNFSTSADLTISNTKGSISAHNELIWEGDVTNNGDLTLENVEITFECYSEAREKVGVATTIIKYINPKETLHFTASGVGQYNSDIKCEYKIK